MIIFYPVGLVHPAALPPPPLADALRRLEEAGVIRLLESLVGLSDEGGGPLHALLAAGDLLGELPQAHRLGENKSHVHR